MRIPLYYQNGKLLLDVVEEMDDAQLRYIWTHHCDGLNSRELFPTGGKNSQRITRRLSEFARAKIGLRDRRNPHKPYLTLVQELRKELHELIQERG